MGCVECRFEDVFVIRMQNPNKRAALPVASGFIPRLVTVAFHAVGKSQWQEAVPLYKKQAIGKERDYTGG